MDAIDLKTLAHRTGIPLRTLRYVLDHHILPNAQKVSRGSRIPRTLTLFEAFALALAAELLALGLKRDLVSSVIAALCAAPIPPSSANVPLWRAYTGSGPVQLEIENARVCVVVGDPYRPYRSPWLGLAGFASPSGGCSMRLTADLTPLRRALQGAH